MISGPRARTTARCTACSSSRTLPGQAWSRILATASALKPSVFCARGAYTARKVAGQGREVREPLAQGRHAERDHVQAMVEVLAKPARPHEAGEVLVRGGQDADINADGVPAADAADLALLEGPEELGLDAAGGLADLVQEDGAAVGLLEPARLGLEGAGEGAALVAEELALGEGVGDGGAVDGDEGAGVAGAPGVDEAGDQLLARAGLAFDEDGGVSPPDLIEDGRGGRRMAGLSATKCAGTAMAIDTGTSATQSSAPHSFQATMTTACTQPVTSPTIVPSSSDPYVAGQPEERDRRRHARPSGTTIRGPPLRMRASSASPTTKNRPTVRMPRRWLPPVAWETAPKTSGPRMAALLPQRA